jgi:hypothetical protein
MKNRILKSHYEKITLHFNSKMISTRTNYFFIGLF